MTDALFAVDPEARTITGLVLPFDELSAPSLSGTEPIMFSAGTVTLPEDPSIVTLYGDLREDHDRHDPRGRATALEVTDRGIVGTFAVARTPEGDAMLARAQETPRPRLSAELADIVRSGARAISSRLTGTGVVGQGAFASAGLFSAAPETPAEEADTETPAEETPDAETEETEEVSEMEEVVTQIATLPEGVASPAGTDNADTSASGLFAAIANAERSGDKSGLFAIANVQHSGPSGATIGADAQRPAYEGELWKRQPYQPVFMPLLNEQTLTSYKVDGWRWTNEPQVGDYAGNVTEVPSNAVDTEPVSVTASRVAGGHKIDRRFQDFGDQGVIDSYFRLQSEDVVRKLDGKALAAIVAGATAQSVSAHIFTGAEAYPVGIAGIVDGALGVIASENVPTFAIVSPELWRDIVLTGKNDVLAYLQAGFGLTEGSLDGFKIRPGAVGAGNVIVGAKPALSFYRTEGIRVDAIDPHNGSIDPAVYAYYATLLHNGAAIKSVNTASYDDGEA